VVAAMIARRHARIGAALRRKAVAAFRAAKRKSPSRLARLGELL
jgi:hypothetical protein